MQAGSLRIFKKSQNMWHFLQRLVVLELENISHYKNAPGSFKSFDQQTVVLNSS